MATVRAYIKRMPLAYQHRYDGKYWVGWANGLLERLSGAGVLPPQHVIAGVVPRQEIWIDKPPMCRDVKELRFSERSRGTLRFAEENDRLRLMDVQMPDPPERVRHDVTAEQTGRITIRGNVDANGLAGWLFVVTQGGYEGRTLVVEGNSATAQPSGTASVYLRDLPPPVQDEETGVVTRRITDGYFVSPRGYLVLSYVAAYTSVVFTDDELGIRGYENLADAWFRWKIAEQIDVKSDECEYWGGRFEVELARLRGEMLNRINTPQGRRLVGFEGNRRF